MNKKWFKSSVSMVMAALVLASGAAVLTTGAVETAGITASAADSDYPYIEYFKASHSSAALGTTISFESRRVGAEMHYGMYQEYRIVISKDGEVVKELSDRYVRDEYFQFCPTECGKYTATLYVTDFKSRKLEPKSTTFEIYPTGAQITSFSCSSQSVIKRVDSRIQFYATINASTTPGRYYPSYRYSYVRIYKDNKLVTKLDFNETPMKQSFWTPKEAGKYTAKLTVLGENYDSAETSFDFDVVESYIESFWATQQYNSFVGTPIQFNSVEKNACMWRGYYQEYKIVVKDEAGNVVDTIDDQFKQAENLVFTPTKAGKYTATLTVRDYYGFLLPEKTIDITVVAPYISNFKVSPKSPILNKEATFTSNPVYARSYHGMFSSYKIVIKDSNKKTVATLSDKYGSSLKWTPKAVGKYTATLNVVDFYGYKVPSKTISFTVVKPLSATAKLSATSVKAGNSVTATLTAANGAGSNQYAFDYRKVGASSWTVVKGYNKTNNTKVTIKTAGSYEVRMRVKDANGTVVTKTVKLTVTK